MTVSTVRHRPAPTHRETRGPGTTRGLVPRWTRRLSGPASGRLRATPQESATLPVRALAIVRGLPDHSLIDRLVRGRAWIPVLGVLLAGIVAMQVEILKLGTSIGRSLDRTAVLQSQDQSLQMGVAALRDDQRIERLAASMGMVMPSPSSLTFLSAETPDRVGRALAGIHSPDPASFAAQLAAALSAAAMIAPSTATAAPPGAAPTTADAPGAGASEQTGTSGVGAPSAGTEATAPAGSGPTGQPGGVGTTEAAAPADSTAPAGGISSPGAGASGSSTGAAGLSSSSTSPIGSPAGG